jgi:5,10-methylenetetrahydromethanopterin reductase
VSVRFGINFLPGEPAEFVSWVTQAEDSGFELVGISDSQAVYRDVYVSAALCATNTSRVRFGPRVINPITRHPSVAAAAAATVEELAPGRTMVGIGTGYSAVYTLGLKPANRAGLREYVQAMRGLMTTGEAVYQGNQCTMSWGRKRVPIYIAAAGPRTLRLAGQIADGAIIATGLLPEVVQDSIAQVEAGAREAGRDPSEIDLWWFPLMNIAADRQTAIQDIKMSLASPGSQLAQRGTAGKHVPPELEPKFRELDARYRYDEHVKPGGTNARLVEELGLIDYLADRFAIVGPPADCIQQIEQAAEAGANQLWISVHFDDKARFIRDFARQIMPAFR